MGYGLMRHIQKGAIGPYFLENESVNGDSYEKMIRYFLLLRLREYRQDLIF